MSQSFNYYNQGQKANKIDLVGVINHDFNIVSDRTAPIPLLNSISQNNQKPLLNRQITFGRQAPNVCNSQFLRITFDRDGPVFNTEATLHHLKHNYFNNDHKQMIPPIQKHQFTANNPTYAKSNQPLAYIYNTSAQIKTIKEDDSAGCWPCFKNNNI